MPSIMIAARKTADTLNVPGRRLTGCTHVESALPSGPCPPPRPILCFLATITQVSSRPDTLSV